MAKGGRTEQRANMPAFAETLAQQTVGVGQDAAATGYTPMYGIDVAGFSPMQEASFQGTDMMASAFGMPTTMGQSYLPPTKTMGGITGYSSGDVFDANVAALENRRPAQVDYIESFSINPVTGEMGSRVPDNQPVALEMQGQGRRGK
tara:strand:- start:3 stop:443 length:441 start_codon:yes stop_codon:yes gene_type:complete